MFNQQQLLFTPGPVPITESVQDAMLDLVYHKHEGFANVHQEVMSHLQTIIGTDGPILIAPGSGTTGAEIFMRGLVPFQSNVLVLVQGRFSSRWAELGRMFGHNVMTLKSAWGEYNSLESLQQVLREHHFHSIWITHTETSTAITVPLKEYCEIIHACSPETLIIVDAVSSIGIEQFNMKGYGIDCVFTASQKGLAAPPGATIMALSNRATEKAKYYSEESMIFPTMVHNLPGLIHASQQHLPYFTPPLPIIAALHASCKHIVESKTHFEDLSIQARNIKQSISKINGCDVIGNAIGVTAVKHDFAPRIRTSMYEHGIIIAPGQDEWASSVFRIGHMVSYSPNDIQRLTKTITMICESL